MVTTVLVTLCPAAATASRPCDLRSRLPSDGSPLWIAVRYQSHLETRSTGPMHRTATSTGYNILPTKETHDAQKTYVEDVPLGQWAGCLDRRRSACDWLRR